MLTVGYKYLDTVDESCGQNPEASKGNLLLSWRGMRLSCLIVMYIIYDLFVIKLLRHICLVPAANESCSMRWKYLDISNFTIGSAPHGVVWSGAVPRSAAGGHLPTSATGNLDKLYQLVTNSCIPSPSPSP